MSVIGAVRSAVRFRADLYLGTQIGNDSNCWPRGPKRFDPALPGLCILIWGPPRLTSKVNFMPGPVRGRLVYHPNSNTRGNNYKLLNQSFHYDARKYCFSANDVVDVSNVNQFKACLDAPRCKV